MQIISHRGNGFGRDLTQNSLSALRKCLENGFGIETDIRDYCGELVISHDPGTSTSPKLTELFDIYKNNCELPLALNIKADGIGESMLELLNKYEISDYFTFDMSFPQTLEYHNAGLKFFTRQSEYEIYPLLYEESAGVWIDSFYRDDWIVPDLILRHLDAGKKICIVSSELHKREHMSLWQKLKDSSLHNIMLCTDYPAEADDFFN